MYRHVLIPARTNGVLAGQRVKTFSVGPTVTAGRRGRPVVASAVRHQT
jgi:hypothetical protein